MPRRDLSLDEQKRVLAYLRALRSRFGNWWTLEKALPISHSQRVEVTSGRAEVSAAIAFRIAKLLDVSLYDVLNGTALPPNTCPHCGNELPVAGPSENAAGRLDSSTSNARTQRTGGTVR